MFRRPLTLPAHLMSLVTAVEERKSPTLSPSSIRHIQVIFHHLLSMPHFKSRQSVSPVIRGHYSCTADGAGRSVLQFSITDGWAEITVGIAHMQASPQAV